VDTVTIGDLREATSRLSFPGDKGRVLHTSGETSCPSSSFVEFGGNVLVCHF
jgi:hypothetical protein